jgi:hypothetical protein
LSVAKHPSCKIEGTPKDPFVIKTIFARFCAAGEGQQKMRRENRLKTVIRPASGTVIRSVGRDFSLSMWIGLFSYEKVQIGLRYRTNDRPNCSRMTVSPRFGTARLPRISYSVQVPNNTTKLDGRVFTRRIPMQPRRQAGIA